MLILLTSVTGVNVTGAFAWAIYDNFEWFSGCVTRPRTVSLAGPVQLLEKLQSVEPNHRLVDYEFQILECVID